MIAPVTYQPLLAYTNPVAPPPLSAPSSMPQDTWQPTMPQLQSPQPVMRAARGGGSFDDLVALIATNLLSFPLAGAGALLGVFLGNPALAATLAVGGGCLVGLLVAGNEIWAGTRPGVTLPVRWKMVGGSLIVPGLTAIGAGIGYAGAGTAAAIATGACVAAGLPFALLLGTIIYTRIKNSKTTPVPVTP